MFTADEGCSSFERRRERICFTRLTRSVPYTESLTELIRDVVIELLPQQQDDGQVLVNVSWTYISDPSKVNFSITLITFDDESFATDTVEISGVTHFTAKLLDNTLYEVVVSGH